MMISLKNAAVKPNMKLVPAYLAMVFIGALYMFLYNRQFGVAFMAVIALAPLISVLTVKKAASGLRVDINLTRSLVDKGEHVGMTVTFECGGLFPVPFLYAELNGGIGLSGSDDNFYIISVSKAKPGVIEKNYKAEMWGSVPLGVSAVRIHDFLGLFQIVFNGDLPQQHINVRPALHEPLKNDLLAFILNEMTVDDKEDESSDKMSFLSQPGYTFRPYSPPDAMGRINWKLFAKLEKYLVRENEYIKNQSPVILLDRRGLVGNAPMDRLKEAAVFEERTIEAVLANLLSMVRQSVVCKVCYFDGGAWQEHVVGDDEQIADLQDEFARYSFTSDDSADRFFFDKTVIDGGKIMLFTCALDYELDAELTAATANGYDITVISPENLGAYRENLWVVNENYDFYAV